MTPSLLRPRRSFLALAFCLALCLFLLGSGGGSAGADATASATKRVSIVNFAFKPGTLKVNRGAAVTFANTADTTHTASGGAFANGKPYDGSNESRHPSSEPAQNGPMSSGAEHRGRTAGPQWYVGPVSNEPCARVRLR